MFVLRKMGEERFTGIAGRNAGRQNYACSPVCAKQSADCFGKDRVSVDVAFGGERKAFALAEEFADAIGGVDGSDKFGVQRGIFLDEFRDELGAGSLVGCGGNPWVACGEKFLLLQFDAFHGGLLSITSKPP